MRCLAPDAVASGKSLQKKIAPRLPQDGLSNFGTRLEVLATIRADCSPRESSSSAGGCPPHHSVVACIDQTLILRVP